MCLVGVWLLSLPVEGDNHNVKRGLPLSYPCGYVPCGGVGMEFTRASTGFMPVLPKTVNDRGGEVGPWLVGEWLLQLPVKGDKE